MRTSLGHNESICLEIMKTVVEVLSLTVYWTMMMGTACSDRYMVLVVVLDCSFLFIYIRNVLRDRSFGECFNDKKNDDDDDDDDTICDNA